MGLVANGAQDVYLTGPPQINPEVTYQRTPSSVPDSAPDVNGPGTPQEGTPPGGCSSLMCLVPIRRKMFTLPRGTLLGSLSARHPAWVAGQTSSS